jgi:hypothetical protein
MAPGVAWRYEANGENVAVEVSSAVAKAAEYAWRMRWVDGRTVADFLSGGVTYSQPCEDDPRAKTRALGSTKKRSKFMAEVQRARAEEAERQGKGAAKERPIPAPAPVRRKKRTVELLPP